MSLRIVFMGTPEFAVPSLEALISADYNVVGVFTQPDKPKGRGKKVSFSPIKELALHHNIPVFQPNKMREDGLPLLKELAPDLCITAAFGQILSQDALDIPKFGTINVHASLLPKHRGSAPVQWAILQGDKTTGVTTMLTDRGIDTGDMLLKSSTDITEDDTAETLLTRLSTMGATLLLTTIENLSNNTLVSEKQNDSESTYDPMLTKELGQINFSDNSQNILRLIRAMNPWPSSYIITGTAPLKVWSAQKANILKSESTKPGEILLADAKKGFYIATADGAIELLEIQAPNSKRMNAKAYLLGHPFTIGELISEAKI